MSDRDKFLESELMGELKDIKNIIMDVVPAKKLYGNTLKTTGFIYLYFVVVFLLQPFFSFIQLHYQMSAAFILKSVLLVILMASVSFFFIPVWFVFSYSYNYFLFKEGIAPNLKYGKYLFWKIKTFIKKTLFIHFILSIIIAFLSFFIKDEIDAWIASLIGTLGVSIVTFIIASSIFNMELVRLGTPNLLEMVKNIAKKD